MKKTLKLFGIFCIGFTILQYFNINAQQTSNVFQGESSKEFYFKKKFDSRQDTNESWNATYLNNNELVVANNVTVGLDTDVLIRRYDLNGNIIKERKINNYRWAGINSIYVDENNFIYLTMMTSNDDNTGDIPALGHPFDGMVVKLDSDLNIIKYKYINNEYLGKEFTRNATYGITVDSEGNLIVNFAATGKSRPFGNHDAAYDGALVKYDKDLNEIAMSPAIKAVNNPYGATVEGLPIEINNRYASVVGPRISAGINNQYDLKLVIYNKDLTVYSEKTAEELIGQKMIEGQVIADETNIYLIGRINDLTTSYPLVIIKMDLNGNVLESKQSTNNVFTTNDIKNIYTIDQYLDPHVFLRENDIYYTGVINTYDRGLYQLNKTDLTLIAEKGIPSIKENFTATFSEDSNTLISNTSTQDNNSGNITIYEKNRAPIITVNETTAKINTQMPAISDLIANAQDEDTNLTYEIIENNIDLTKIGSYSIKIKVTDTLGQFTIATTKVQTFRDPSLSAKDEATIYLNDNINIKSLFEIAAVNMYDQNISDQITIDDSQVDYKKVGKYKIKLTVLNNIEKNIYLNIIEKNEIPLVKTEIKTPLVKTGFESNSLIYFLSLTAILSIILKNLYKKKSI